MHASIPINIYIYIPVRVNCIYRNIGTAWSSSGRCFPEMRSSIRKLACMHVYVLQAVANNHAYAALKCQLISAIAPKFRFQPSYGIFFIFELSSSGRLSRPAPVHDRQGRWPTASSRSSSAPTSANSTAYLHWGSLVTNSTTAKYNFACQCAVTIQGPARVDASLRIALWVWAWWGMRSVIKYIVCAAAIVDRTPSVKRFM